MIKVFIAAILIFSCIKGAQAKSKSIEIFNIELADVKKRHIYKLVKERNKYTLYFQNHLRKTKRTTVNETVATQLASEATHLFWANKYRRPSSIKTCKDYAILRLGKDKTGICKENKRLVGMSYGFFHSLHVFFK